MKRNIILLLLSLVTAYAATAQDNPRQRITTTQENYTQGVGWIHTHIGTNWYASLEGTGHLYYGFEDREGSFGDRLSWGANGYIGRWVFPMIGVRVGLGYATYNGFITRVAYEENKRFDDQNKLQGTWVGNGECDFENGQALHGYYHHTDNANLLHQYWTAVHVAPDLMINLSYANFYNPDKRFTTYAYMGVAFHVGLNEVCINPANGIIESSYKSDHNTASDFHVGIIENFQLGKHFNIYGDVRLTMYEGHFDREDVRGVETFNEDFGLSASLGISYKFNFLSKKKYADWYREHIDHNLAEGALAPAPDHLYTTQSVQYDTVRIDETVFVFDTLSEFDPEVQRLLDSLVGALLGDTSYCDTCGLGELLERIPYEMVFFELDKWDIVNTEITKISKMARLMKRYPDYKFLLFGSADSKTGTVQRNELLSVNRADVVYNKLVYEYDIPAEQLQRVYLGGILDYEPYELNRATCIIMDHPRVMEEFMKLRAEGQAGGGEVQIDKK